MAGTTTETMLDVLTIAAAITRCHLPTSDVTMMEPSVRHDPPYANIYDTTISSLFNIRFATADTISPRRARRVRGDANDATRCEAEGARSAVECRERARTRW